MRRSSDNEADAPSALRQRRREFGLLLKAGIL
jgi:hypothetical protein